MANILVIRLSAMGDVAMSLPVVYSVAKANPDDSFTVLTQTALTPLFINRPPNVFVRGINLRTTERTLSGLLSYVRQLRKEPFDRIVDLHCSIRSRIICWAFRLSGKSVFSFDKQRGERRQLTARPPKTLRQLRPVIARYADVFRAAGCREGEEFISLYDNHAAPALPDEIAGKEGRRIGIAPFARHKSKIYPLEKMEQVVASLVRQKDVTIYLFGGSGEESDMLNSWADKYGNIINVTGRYPLGAELAILSRMDALVSMDSSNMHLASLVGVKVISVWGATHPCAGFYGFRQRANMVIQAELPCRPCSIYGNKRCYRGDYACLNSIEPEQIVCKVNEETVFS